MSGSGAGAAARACAGAGVGTALVLVGLAVHALPGSWWQASRGSGVALLAVLGAQLHVVYHAVRFRFLTRLNAAFLVYVALPGPALWSTGHLCAAHQLWAAAEGVAARAPVGGVAAYVWGVTALNAIAWLARFVPSLGADPAPVLAGTGVQPNAIFGQHLAVRLPLAAVAAL